MTKLNLNELAEMINIASEAKLPVDQLMEIGQKVTRGFEEDMASSMPWLRDVRRVTKLASLESTKKSKPLPNSANVKYPLITEACYQFASSTYPEIIKDNKVVKYVVLGKDEDLKKDAQGQRTAAYMNYQLLQKSTEWEKDLDMLVNQLPLIGFMCKKQRYNPMTDEIESELCHYEDLIVNDSIKSLAKAERISHIQTVTLNDLISASRQGVYLEEPISRLSLRLQSLDQKPAIKIIEQHTFLDLDKDGYEEPYIITILQENSEVLRISARYNADKKKEKGEYSNLSKPYQNSIKRNKNGQVVCIKAKQYFKDYHFLKSPKGTFRGVGFGILLLHMNEMVNSLSNMLLDAGQLATIQGGYIDSEFKCLETGESLHDPGHFKKVKVPYEKKLADGVFPILYKEPSQVLHTMLGVLVEAAKQLTSSTEVMSGSASPENSKTGATLALLHQGQQSANAIRKRFYCSMKDELQGIFDLNYDYCDNEVYVEVVGDEIAVCRTDFDSSVINIIPVADPNLSSESQRASTMQVLIAALQIPGVNPVKVGHRILKNSTIENPEELMLSPDEMNQPNPEVIQVQADIEHKAQQINAENRKIDVDEKRIQLDALLAQSQVILNRAKAKESVAKAEAAEAGVQGAEYDRQLGAIQTQLDHMLNMAKLEQENIHRKEDRVQQQVEHEDNRDLYQQEVDLDAQQSTGVDEPPAV